MHCPSLFSVVSVWVFRGFVFACIAALFLFCAVSAARDSGERIDVLRSLTRAAVAEEGAALSAAELRRRVLKEYGAQVEVSVPPEEEAVPMEACRRKVALLLEAGAKEEFPMPGEEELARAAAEEYPIHKKGDAVSIRYRINPVRTSTLSGIFQGRDGNHIKIGGQSILVRDVRAAPGTEDELLKFDPERCKQKRRQYIARRREAVLAQRAEWKEEQRGRVLAAVLEKQREVNEARGYLFYEQHWRSPSALLDSMLGQLRAGARPAEPGDEDADDEVLPAPENTDGQTLPEPGDATADTTAAGDGGRADDRAEPPEDGGGTGPDTPADSDSPGSEDGSPSSTDKGEAKPAERTPLPRDSESAASDGFKEELPADRATGEEPASGADKNLPLLAILGVLLAVLLLIGAVLCFPDPARGRYYPGRNEQAEIDPIRKLAGVPHVIARFPNRERGLSVLAGLSCLSMRSKRGAELRSRQPLEYGFVPEEGGTFLGFVGGASFSYPLWREARDMMQRPRDVEVLNSEAPSADVRVPEEGAAAAAVTEVGRVDGDENDPSCYWIFQAETRQAARAFLKEVRVNTAGWQVVVQTPEGHWGRDRRGLYQE